MRKSPIKNIVWILHSFNSRSIARNDTFVLETFSFFNSSPSGKISLKCFSEKALSLIAHKSSIKQNTLIKIHVIWRFDFYVFVLYILNMDTTRKYQLKHVLMIKLLMNIIVQIGVYLGFSQNLIYSIK